MSDKLFGGVGMFANTKVEPVNRSIVESIIVNNLLKMNESDMKSFLKSAKAEAMVEAGILRENTVCKLEDRCDLDQQIALICLQLAKESEDCYSEALKKVQEEEAEYIVKICRRYNDEAKTILKKIQDEYCDYVAPIETEK